MKEYPHIMYAYQGIFGENIYAFDKLDGSNIRVEWNRKIAKKNSSTGGYVKFGTKSQLIDNTNEFFGDSVDIFYEKYADDLNKIFFEEKYFRNIDLITFFLEYFGPNSFAGFHELTDKKDLVLFDVNLYKKGLMPPKLFVEYFGHLHIPDVVYVGNYNKEFINSIYENEVLNEGIVCKGVRKTKGNDVVWMTKVKTKRWLDRLKNKFGEERLKEEFL